MPSTVVHVALAGLIGVALLGDEFDTRAILFVMGVTALLDLDTLIGVVVPGLHRAALHNVFVVLVPALLVLWDVSVRDESFLADRWGAYGHRVAWASLAALLFAHVLLDAFFNGVALLWPLHDTFYDLSGKLVVTDQRGLVQTFVELETAADGSTAVGDSTTRGNTSTNGYSTGFNPAPHAEEPPQDVERVFPIAATGERFVLTLAGFGVVLVRVYEDLHDD